MADRPVISYNCDNGWDATQTGTLECRTVGVMAMNCLFKIKKKSFAGFTLIELLTVMAIIGVLTALILPAVQAARESSRRTACKSHLAQLAKGMIQHESQHGYFPTGGWSENWLGTPDRSTDSGQPGGWTFTVLPFIEEVVLQDSVAAAGTAQIAYSNLCVTPVSPFSCPSRRGVSPVDDVDNEEEGTSFKTSFQGSDRTVTITRATRCDYAASGGAIGACPPVPTSMTIDQYLNLVGTGGGGTVTIIHHPPAMDPHFAYCEASLESDHLQKDFPERKEFHP